MCLYNFFLFTDLFTWFLSCLQMIQWNQPWLYDCSTTLAWTAEEWLVTSQTPPVGRARDRRREYRERERQKNANWGQCACLLCLRFSLTVFSTFFHFSRAACFEFWILVPKDGAGFRSVYSTRSWWYWILVTIVVLTISTTDQLPPSRAIEPSLANNIFKMNRLNFSFFSLLPLTGLQKASCSAILQWWNQVKDQMSS